MATTPNLGLTTYDVSSGSTTTFLAFRTAVAGTVSNMTIIDNGYGDMLNAIGALRSTSVYSVSATLVGSNYYTATVTSLTAYSTGMTINLKLNATNTGSVTLNLNAIGVITLKKIENDGSIINIASGDMIAGRWYTLVYDGTYFVLTAANNVATSASVVGQEVMSNTSGSVVRHNGSGVTSGSYNRVEVDSYGHVLSGSVVDSGHVIRYNGSDMPQRGALVFYGGGVSVTDDGGNNQSNVYIPSTESRLVLPDFGAFSTWINQDTTTFTDINDGYGGYYLTNSGSFAGISGLVRDVSLAASDIYAKCALLTLNSSGSSKMFFGWRDSSTGAISGLAWDDMGGLEVQKWSGSTTPDGTYQSRIGSAKIGFSAFLWVYLRNEGVNRTIYISLDGRVWTGIHSVAYNDYLNPDQNFYGIISGDNTFETKALIYSYQP